MFVLFVSYVVPLVRDIRKTFLLLTHFLPSAVCACFRGLCCLLHFLLPERFDIYCILHAPAVISKLTPSFFIPTRGLFSFLSLSVVGAYYLGFLPSYCLCCSAFCTSLFEFCFIPTALVSNTECDMSQIDSAVSI